MKLFKKKHKKQDSDIPTKRGIDLEQIVEDLSTQPPKSMEKILTLAKAKREYNQKMRTLQQSLETPEPEEDASGPENILEALNELDGDDLGFQGTFIEAKVPDDADEEKEEKKGKK